MKIGHFHTPTWPGEPSAIAMKTAFLRAVRGTRPCHVGAALLAALPHPPGGPQPAPSRSTTRPRPVMPATNVLAPSPSPLGNYRGGPWLLPAVRACRGFTTPGLTPPGERLTSVQAGSAVPSVFSRPVVKCRQPGEGGLGFQPPPLAGTTAARTLLVGVWRTNTVDRLWKATPRTLWWRLHCSWNSKARGA